MKYLIYQNIFKYIKGFYYENYSYKLYIKK